MKFSLRLLFTFAFITLTASFSAAQVDSIVGQFTSVSGGSNAFVRSISGDGRFVVVESNGNISTERTAERNNADGNTEIFLFDYGQRRIFQITDTKNALNSISGSATASDNIRIAIINTLPVVSFDGRWIAFVSNAGVNVAGNTTPGSFNGNACTSLVAAECNATANSQTNPNRTTLAPLIADANTEIWLYQIPAVAAVDLTFGENLPLTDLAAGSFVRVTDSPAQFPARGGTTSAPPSISFDNDNPSVNDDGTVVAFVSDRDYNGGGNGGGSAPNEDLVNEEIFTFVRTGSTGTIQQITRTPRGTILLQVSNVNPTISGSGGRVAFTSTASNPNDTLTGTSNNSNNADFNNEIFYADLTGGAITRLVQITNTVRDNQAQVINLYNVGKRMSRDGRFIAYESMSANPAANGANQTVSGNPNYAVFVYDATPPGSTPSSPGSTRQIGVRTFDDAGASGGDVRRFPTFTDSTGPTNTAELVFVSRLNYDAAAAIPGTASSGLNPDAARNPQIYATPLYRPPTGTETNPVATANLTRLTRFQSFSDVQPYVSATRRRITFNYVNELGGGNSDFSYEGFYLISSNVVPPDSAQRLDFATGASALPVGTPQTIPTPTPSPSPAPSPTPTTPTAVPALAPGMIAIAEYRGNSAFEIVNAGGASTRTRSFELPIELAGVTVNVRSTANSTVNGGQAAAGIYTIDRQRRRFIFVLPKGLANGNYVVTINDNNTIYRGSLDITGAQPDVLAKNPLPTFGGRAVAFNATNRVLQIEPFSATTVRLRPYGRVPTVVRIFVTGIRGAAASQITVRVGGQAISGAGILTGAVETDAPGVYSVDFALPAAANGEGDVPIIVTVIGNNSRLDDTAPRIRIL